MKEKLLVVGESFSPWTKKARWALEQCGLNYDYQEYTPTLSEPGLRWRMKQWTGSVSVPVLFVDAEVIRGSWDIARYANDITGGKHLGDFSDIEPWNKISELALAQGRTNLVRRILDNKQALEESLPTFIPNSWRSSLRFIAKGAIQHLDRKYAHLVQAGALHEALLHTREVLAQNENDYLLNYFSYADISMAVVVEVFAPIAQTIPQLGPATQNCWNDLTLTEEFQDLVAWRDRLAAEDSTSYSQFKTSK